MYFLSFSKEVLYVAIYCSFIYWILTFILTNDFLLFFVFGFLKHLLGYYTGRQDMFCNYGYSCLKIHEIRDDKKEHKATSNNLLLESFFEGLWFLFWGTAFLSVFGLNNPKIRGNNKYKLYTIIFIFLLGGFTHVLAEFTGLHTFFCRVKCLPVEK